MKVALCFIISYSHTLNKEHIWKEWITPNKDIINIYFHYKDYTKIQSAWIKKHVIPPNSICETSYYHVVPAYMTLMSFALHHCADNQWFCFLTDSCVPIISPLRFRELFFENYSKSIMSWREAWWNTRFCNRANLSRLQKEFHLANDPWFVLKREDVCTCIHYSQKNPQIFKLICNGPVANESMFAIMLYSCNKLKEVLPLVTHAANWSKMSSATSPYVFQYGNEEENAWITAFLEKNKYTIFLRKIDPALPDHFLRNIIYISNKDIIKQRIRLFCLEKWIFMQKNTWQCLLLLGMFFLFLIYQSLFF